MHSMLDRSHRRTVYAAVGLVTLLIVLVPYAVRSTAAAGSKTPQTTTLYTAVLVADSNGGLSCSATNVSTVQHTISMDLINAVDGTPLATTAPAQVDPSMTIQGGLIAANPGYCRITVDGPGSDIRAEALLAEGTQATAAVALAY